MNIINFNWSKMNSSLSSFLCINCTKQGWRITCYLKLYYESEDFKQTFLKSMKSFTKSDLHLRALSSNHSRYRCHMIHLSVTKIIFVAAVVHSITADQEWTPASGKRIPLLNMSTLRVKIRKENAMMCKQNFKI